MLSYPDHSFICCIGTVYNNTIMMLLSLFFGDTISCIGFWSFEATDKHCNIVEYLSKIATLWLKNSTVSNTIQYVSRLSSLRRYAFVLLSITTCKNGNTSAQKSIHFVKKSDGSSCCLIWIDWHQNLTLIIKVLNPWNTFRNNQHCSDYQNCHTL